MKDDIEVIIYASDASNGSWPVFETAIHQAIQHKAEIVYVHAVNKVDAITPDVSYSYLPQEVEQLHTEQQKQEVVEKIKARIHRFTSDKLADLEQKPKFSVSIQFGNPDEIIINSAKQSNAGLIVMGNRKTSALSRVFLGSTANKVLQKSSIPVLIVPIAG